jgi:hypothetical protein
MAHILVVEPAPERAPAPAIAIQTRRPGFTARHPHQIVTDIWVRREAAWRPQAVVEQR